MPSGPFTEHETLIPTKSGSHLPSVQLGLGIHSRGTTRGFNEESAPALLSLSIYRAREEAGLVYLEKAGCN